MKTDADTIAMEAVANVAISMVIGLATQLVMFPALGIPVSIDQNLIILAVMTVVSLVRSRLPVRTVRTA